MSRRIPPREVTELPEPFSGANYGENKRLCKNGQTPCVFCGKGVANGKVGTRYAVVIDLGGRRVFALRRETYPDNENMGCWPIGSDCWKRYGSALRNAGAEIEEGEWCDDEY